MQRKAVALLGELGSPAGVEDRADLEARFGNAITRLWMAFQPIVEVGGGRVVAYEALLRTEEASLRRPDVFLGVAERLGRIQEVGRLVRASVARAAADAPAGAELFVNLHGLELNDEELYSPSSPLTQIADRVIPEITERVALDRVADVTTRVAMLRRLGFRIAVDDLGAGYAGLASLAALEPGVVKLDISLVRGIDAHPRKRRVVGAMATMCRELGSRVVAEGVETEAERATIADLGVPPLQGYLFARPGPGFPAIAVRGPG
ncbi:MAG: EAL domain-containing protein [Myxococcales bacterium]|nr:EAL domain-containing protein [Myxococcales bacterium]